MHIFILLYQIYIFPLCVLFIQKKPSKNLFIIYFAYFCNRIFVHTMKKFHCSMKVYYSKKKTSTNAELIICIHTSVKISFYPNNIYSILPKAPAPVECFVLVFNVLSLCLPLIPVWTGLLLMMFRNRKHSMIYIEIIVGE